MLEKPLNLAEVRAATASEGLELVPSTSNAAGFKGVFESRGKYKVNSCGEGGKKYHFGCFATPEGAALHLARHVGLARAAAEAAKARREGRAPAAHSGRGQGCCGGRGV